MQTATTRSRTRVLTPWLTLPTFWRATVAGIIATFAMTAWIYVTQVFGISQIEVARALGMLFGVQGDALLIGTGLHMAIGIALGLLYAYGFYELLPGPGWVRGLTFSLLPTTFLLVFVPLMAWGLVLAGTMAFGALAAGMWIINQLVYGLVLGVIFGAE